MADEKKRGRPLKGGLRKGAAKIEFIAVKDKVKPLIDQGYDITSIYHKLSSDGLITMSYPGFYGNFQREILMKKRSQQKKEVQTLKEAASDAIASKPAIKTAFTPVRVDLEQELSRGPSEEEGEE